MTKLALQWCIFYCSIWLFVDEKLFQSISKWNKTNNQSYFY